ncbi:MAG: ribonuclease III [Chloroflexi bacterium]|nr:ribonuclease III [Chloroflexota bacterium]
MSAQSDARDQNAERDELRLLEEALGHQFRDRSILVQALTHRSFVHEHPEGGKHTNERLEFLGDAIFHFVVADEVFNAYPDAPEGTLTALRASLVCTPGLAAIAEDLGLARFVRVSRGEATIDGRGRQSILADALEAVVAAVYRDAGLEAARDLVRRLVRPRIPIAAAQSGTSNAKGRLQEIVQAIEGVTPVYRVRERSGPVHAEHFVVEVVAGDRVLARGEGQGKRFAEQQAARAALASLAYDDEAGAAEGAATANTNALTTVRAGD